MNVCGSGTPQIHGLTRCIQQDVPSVRLILTEYFCGLESKKCTSKIIPKIERDAGKTITKQFYILKETKVFYEELYKFREGNRCKVSDLETDLKDLNFNKLSFDEQLSLECK
jgi:hypothetical protein